MKCRSKTGGKFTAHFDYRRRFNLNEQSFMSVNIYLNTVPKELKVATRILQHEPDQGDYWDGFDELTAITKIQPVQGTASVFRDTLWHDGEELLGGDKYLLRTDVVYEREGGWDMDRELEGFGRAEKGQRMMEIAYALDGGGNREEAGRWHEKAAELVPENYR
jgi:hypothetical protein